MGNIVGKDTPFPGKKQEGADYEAVKKRLKISNRTEKARRFSRQACFG
jgi:hypothetical protein